MNFTVESSDPELFDLLNQVCPHLITEHAESKKISLCCAKSQVQTFVQENSLPSAILGRCPTCLYNFRRIFCDMMCHPEQSEFLNASKVVTNPINGKKMVKELEYHVTENYAAQVYQSCADVVNPSTSGSVMDLLCGPWGGALCSPQRLLDYLGSISNGYAPFQINYLLYKEPIDGGLKPHDPPVVPCNVEAVPGIFPSFLHYSKSQIFVQKFNFDMTQHFHEFFTQIFF